ncbi:hypothetical protein DV515_00019076, partial [Chloebia gouldiae]
MGLLPALRGVRGPQDRHRRGREEPARGSGHVLAVAAGSRGRAGTPSAPRADTEPPRRDASARTAPLTAQKDPGERLALPENGGTGRLQRGSDSNS